MAWLFLTIGGILAGQMIYKWRKDIILTTVVTVVIALAGIYLGTIAPSDKVLGASIATSRPVWAVAAFVFCYFAAVLPIWRFALPINYVASYIVFLGLFFGIIGIFVLQARLHAPRLHQLHHRDRPALADHVRDHRLRGDLGLAQHRLELGNGTAVGE